MWLRADTSFLTNPKTLRLSWEARGAFFQLILYAKVTDNRDGLIPLDDLEAENMTLILGGMPEDKCEAVLAELLFVRYLVRDGDHFRFPAWKKMLGDATNTERQARYRARQKADQDVTEVTVTNANVTSNGDGTGRDGTGREGKKTKTEEPPTPIRGGDGNECPKFLSGIEDGSTEMEEWMLIKGKDPRTDAEWAQWVGMCRMRNEVIADCIIIRLAKAGNGWAKRQAISSKEAYEIVNGASNVPDFSKTFRSV